MTHAIETHALGKSYDDREVVHGVDLEVPAGTVLGVLGPNGAGKTTTVRMLATLVDADRGTARVAGYDIATQRRQVRAAIGLTGQYAAVDARLTGRENLVLIGLLHKLGRTGARARAADLLDRFELTDAADRQSRGYSGGMRRRLDLAASLVGDPAVLFLDEPTTGLDPASRQVLWSMITDQARRGVTVLLTTQYLEEADQLADRIVVLDGGRIIADGTADQLKRSVGGELLEVGAPLADLPVVAEVLARATGGAPVVDEARKTVSVPLARGMLGIAAVAMALSDRRVGMTGFTVRKPSLDEVFLALTGPGARPAAPPAAPASAVLDGTGVAA